MKEKTALIVISGVSTGGLLASYDRAFSAFGYTSRYFDPTAARDALIPFAKLVRPALNHLDLVSLNLRANRALVTEAIRLDPSLIIICATEPIRPGTLLQLKVSLPSTPIVAIHPDQPIRIPDGAFAALPLYDVFGVHAKSSVDLLKRAGCKNALYLPCAADPWLHHPEELTAEERARFGCDAIFAGNFRPEHEDIFRVFERSSIDLAVWGSNNWDRYGRHAWVRSRWRGRGLAFGSEYAKAHQAAKVCLNPIDPLDHPAHNQRVFELPACKVFSIVSRTSEVTELFREGETVECFGDANELLDKVLRYRDAPEERRRIAEAAYEHVVHGGHTYRDRARSILDVLGL